jgi:hypothetical protein
MIIILQDGYVGKKIDHGPGQVRVCSNTMRQTLACKYMHVW